MSTQKDFRPINNPPGNGILAWWLEGYNSDGDARIAAIATGETDTDIVNAIYKEWPEQEKAAGEITILAGARGESNELHN